MKKAMVTVLLLAAALLAAAPVQAAIADTLAPAGIALSVLLSGAALAACIYCVVRVRQLVSEHHAFMQSVDKALREYSAQADTSAATINDLASGARAAVNQLSNRLVEQLDKLPVAHDGASAPATNVISIAPVTADTKQAARNPRKALEEALASGALPIALEPVVSVSKAEATGFNVHAALSDSAGQIQFLRRMEGETKGGLPARFELEMIRQAARVCRRQLSGEAPSMPLQVAISKALLRDTATLDETCRLYASQPALCPSLILSLPVHILNGANDSFHDALDRLQAAGVRLACDVRRHIKWNIRAA